jgi:hypothetical protein
MSIFANPPGYVSERSMASAEKLASGFLGKGAPAAGGAGAGAAAGAAGGAANLNWLSKALGGGKGAQFAGGNWWWILPMVLGWYLQKRQTEAQGREMTQMQTGGIEEMTEAISPEDMFYQAMAGGEEQQNQLAQTLLLQQMMGGANLGPQLATGEERIGGR